MKKALAFKEGHRSPPKPRGQWRPQRLAALLLTTPRGWAILALIALVAIAAARWSRVTEGVQAVGDFLLAKAGLAWPLALLWLVSLALVVRLHPRWTVRRWRQWFGILLLLAALTGLASFFFIGSGPLASVNPGGELGVALAGGSKAWAVPRLAPLALIGLWGIAPRPTTWVAVRLGAVLGRGIPLVLRGILGALHALGAVVAWVASALRRARARVRRPTPVVLKDEPPAPAPPQEDADDEDVVLEETDGRWQEARPSVRAAWEAPGLAPEEEAAVAVTAQEEPPAPWLTPGWRLPPLTLLHASSEPPVDAEENQERARLVEQTLGEYGIEVQVTQIKPGPTVTMFGLAPGWIRRRRHLPERDEAGKVQVDEQGRPIIRSVEERRQRVKVDSIIAREKDLALALAAPSLRIEAPVPGESVVGLEVPNPTPSLVTLRSIMESETFQRHARKSPLTLALGKGPGGEAEVADLIRMPHLLIAGSTGSGKSVCINAIIASLLFQCTPIQLRLLLVDPKRVELTPLNGLPHLLKPVVVEPELVVRYLNGLLREMDRRYRRLEELGMRNIQAFNVAVGEGEQMPYIVVCVDELADLIMATPYDAEHAICRLAQLGRATGIHLVVATQRPSVDVVTGLIKANFPSRISFNVVSQVDSRTILDTVGAEKLLGRGDMLFLAPDAAKPKRVQGTFISDEEIEALVQFCHTQPGPPPPPLDLDKPVPLEERGVADGHDSLFVHALKLARSQRQLSTSFLQRRLRIGYPRAARLREELEANGAIGPGGEVLRTEVDELLQSLEEGREE